MRWNEESWQPIASTLGFGSEEEMLRHLYELQHFSIKQIAEVVGYSAFSVRRRLLLLHVELRSRGGPNSSGKRTLRHLSDEVLFNTSPSKLAEELAVHQSTVFAEKRFREKEKQVDGNLAVLCNNSSEVPGESGDGETS